MNSSDIKVALDVNPKALFNVRPRYYYKSLQLGRITEVHVTKVERDQYGSRITPRTVTTYSVEFIGKVRTSFNSKEPVTYEITKSLCPLSAREIEGVYSTSKTLEELRDERTAYERERNERIANDNARQEYLRNRIASRAEIDPHDLYALVTSTLEALDRALDNTTTDNASLSVGGNNQ
jgi:NMD protein affecting ribosome stability and mRNA decay